jgi:AraC family transcriptional regulator
MTNKDIILKAVQYIEDHLKAEISTLDIANSVFYSLYHFIRLFQSITGVSPGTYLQQRRLSEALIDLKNTNKKVIEIAFDYQFNSHEAFTRAFKKQFGINPKQIREGLSLAHLPLLNPINQAYLFQSAKARSEPPQMLELPRIILSGISFFLSDDSKITDLSKEWGQFTQEVSTIKNRIQPERFFQVQYWSENQELGGMYFFIGVEVCNIDEIQPQFVNKIIPNGHYLRFIHKGLANQVGYTYQYIYHQFLPETNYKLTKPFNFEFYGEKCLGPNNPESESEIYIPIELE